MIEKSWARILSYPILDVKVMPGSIPVTSNPGSQSKEKKEIQVDKWGTPKTFF